LARGDVDTITGSHERARSDARQLRDSLTTWAVGGCQILRLLSRIEWSAEG
jgi:hypothetical protein